MNLKYIALIVFLCVSTLYTFGQSLSKYEIHNQILKENCSGGDIGNGTFNNRLNSLEQILITGISKKNFDKTLPHFVDDPLRVTFSYNEETKEHDVPDYEINYTLLKNGQIDKSFIITIKRNIENPISKIHLQHITGLESDRYIDELKKKGYLYRESRSGIVSKHYFNKSKNIYVTITRRMDGSGFNMELSKL